MIMNENENKNYNNNDNDNLKNEDYGGESGENCADRRSTVSP